MVDEKSATRVQHGHLNSHYHSNRNGANNNATSYRQMYQTNNQNVHKLNGFKRPSSVSSSNDSNESNKDASSSTDWSLDTDSSGDYEYGPGIVDRLRHKFMALSSKHHPSSSSTKYHHMKLQQRCSSSVNVSTLIKRCSSLEELAFQQLKPATQKQQVLGRNHLNQINNNEKQDSTKRQSHQMVNGTKKKLLFMQQQNMANGHKRKDDFLVSSTIKCAPSSKSCLITNSNNNSTASLYPTNIVKQFVQNVQNAKIQQHKVTSSTTISSVAISCNSTNSNSHLNPVACNISTCSTVATSPTAICLTTNNQHPHLHHSPLVTNGANSAGMKKVINAVSCNGYKRAITGNSNNLLLLSTPQPYIKRSKSVETLSLFSSSKEKFFLTTVIANQINTNDHEVVGHLDDVQSNVTNDHFYTNNNDSLLNFAKPQPLKSEFDSKKLPENSVNECSLSTNVEEETEITANDDDQFNHNQSNFSPSEQDNANQKSDKDIVNQEQQQQEKNDIQQGEETEIPILATTTNGVKQVELKKNEVSEDCLHNNKQDDDEHKQQTESESVTCIAENVSTLKNDNSVMSQLKNMTTNASVISKNNHHLSNDTSSIIENSNELPKPDTVKTVKRIFEHNANYTGTTNETTSVVLLSVKSSPESLNNDDQRERNVNTQVEHPAQQSNSSKLPSPPKPSATARSKSAVASRQNLVSANTNMINKRLKEQSSESPLNNYGTTAANSNRNAMTRLNSSLLLLSSNELSEAPKSKLVPLPTNGIQTTPKKKKLPDQSYGVTSDQNEKRNYKNNNESVRTSLSKNDNRTEPKQLFNCPNTSGDKQALLSMSITNNENKCSSPINTIVDDKSFPSSNNSTTAMSATKTTTTLIEKNNSDSSQSSPSYTANDTNINQMNQQRINKKPVANIRPFNSTKECLNDDNHNGQISLFSTKVNNMMKCHSPIKCNSEPDATSDGNERIKTLKPSLLQKCSSSSSLDGHAKNDSSLTSSTKSTLWSYTANLKPTSATGSSIVFDFRDNKNVKPNIAIQPAPFGAKPIPKRIFKEIVGGGQSSFKSDDTDEEDDNYCGLTEVPPPSGIYFQGENIVIGSGSLLHKRNKHLSITFDDSQPSIFEYSFEDDDDDDDDDDVDDNDGGGDNDDKGDNDKGQKQKQIIPTSNLVNSLSCVSPSSICSSSSSSSSSIINGHRNVLKQKSFPTGSSNLASYKPTQIEGSPFELGITKTKRTDRTCDSSSSKESSKNTTDNKQQKQIKPDGDDDDCDKNNRTVIKPASVEDTVTFSQSSTASDLLF